MRKDNPFQGGKGLVGGRGDARAEKKREPPIEHRWVLQPYRVAADLEAGRSFVSQGPIEVEVGFGRGHHLRDRILQVPTHRFVGFEVRRMWVERMARWLEREKQENTRLLLADARPLLVELFQAGQVQSFNVFFPDPWWKKRHHKRRVMSTESLDLIHHVLEDGGRLHFRTDVHAYFERVEQLIAEDGRFERVAPDHDAAGRRLPLTHREKKCVENGEPTHSLCALKR